MSETGKIRVRFAPSPTGYLHIGGARTALFNWLWARQMGGSFILRVEDTDENRSTLESMQAILEGLEWLGLDWDEGPDPDPAKFGESIGPPEMLSKVGTYFQSRRAERHKEVIQQLLKEGKAFYCPATAEEMTEKLEGGKERRRLFSPHRDITPEGQCEAMGKAEDGLPVRLKCPRDIDLVWNDTVRGEVKVSSNEVGDFIIQKSSGQLLYNFAVTCDDHDMQITHVLRGEDHISNTPKQLLLYKALGWDAPHFGHVPLIVGMDRAKLSKRHGATAVGMYHENGTLPEALVNFLALIGWAPKDNREMFTLEELIDVFNPADIGKSAGAYNPEKLEHFNGLYIRDLDRDQLYARLQPFIPQHWLELHGEDYVKDVCWLYHDKLTLLSQIEHNAWYFFTPPQHLPDGQEFNAEETGYINPKSVEKFITGNESAADVLIKIYAGFNDVPDEHWDEEHLAPIVDAFCEESGLGKGKVMQPWRVALTGDKMSPGFYDLIVVLGKDETLKRAKPWVEQLQAAGA